MQISSLGQNTFTQPTAETQGVAGQRPHHPHPLARLAQMIDSGNIQGAEAMIQRIAQRHPQMLQHLMQRLQDPRTQQMLQAHGHNPQDAQTIASLIQQVTGGGTAQAQAQAPAQV